MEIIATMTELHQTAIDLAKIEADYTKTLTKLTALRSARRDKKREHKNAIIAAITASPDATHVDLAERFGVTEGTIRHIRRGLTTS